MTMVIVTVMVTMTTLQNDSRSRALRQWHVEEKREFFFFTLCFILFFYLFLQQILQLVPLIIRVESGQKWK